MNFARWVECLRPKAFILENVKGLLGRRNAQGERVIEIIRKTFQNLGHIVEDVWLLNAAEYGVPQVRERIFLVGHESDFVIERPKRTHRVFSGNPDNDQLLLLDDDGLLPAVTLWDAISDLPELGAGEGLEEQPYCKMPQNAYQRWIRGLNANLYKHAAMSHSKRLVERFKHIGWGQSISDVPEEHGARRRNGSGELSEGGYDQNNRRLRPDKPSHTIAASFYANFLHPYQHRNLTAREGARLQSFPDQYRFCGKKTVVSQKLLHREERFDEKYLCQYNQVGNAVPPILARAVAESISNALLLCPISN